MSFQELTSMDEIENLIQTNKLVFLYITQPNCSVCHGLQPQIEVIIAKYPNIQARIINASIVPEIAGRFNVFTAPVLLLFIQGKEYIREARFVQTDVLDKKISQLYENMAD